MSRALRVSDRLYRAALRLYPRAFRARFEDELVDYFAARRERAARSGRLAAVRFWLALLLDLPVSAAREWRAVPRAHPGTRRALFADVGQAWRVLRRSPALSLAVIALVALTVGATTTMFSVTNAVLLRPLPYANPDRLVAIWERRPEPGVDRHTVGAHEFPIWAERATTFTAMAAYTFSGSAVHLSGSGDPAELYAARVTGRFFDVMGVAPLIGRAIGPDDDVPERGDVAVLGHRLWQERFSADPAVLGRSMLLNDRPFRVVGVMPPLFRFPERRPGEAPDLWLAIAEPIHLYRGRHYLFSVARLADGVTLEQANAELASIAGAIAAELPAFSTGHSARAWGLGEDRSAPARPWLLLLLGAAGCLALLGCANVAGLLVARAEGRRREARIRLALGASRGALARQLLAESLLLAVAGGIAGTVLAIFAARAIPALVPADLWTLDRIPIDGAVLGFSLALSIATGLLFGIAPVMATSRAARSGGLRVDGRGVIGTPRTRLRHTLVVAQIGLAVTLTVAAGLLARSLATLWAVDPAYRTADVLSVSVSLPPSRYADPARVRQFYDELRRRAGALPGVQHAVTVNHAPLDGSYDAIAYAAEGQPPAPPGEERQVRYRVVSPGYFDALGIPVLEGRAFTAAEARRALPLIRWYPQQPESPFATAPQPAPVAVVNETTARTVWPDGAVGRRFRLLHSPWITVIGVVADSRGDSLVAGLRPEAYLVDSQEPAASMNLLVAAEHPERYEPDLRRIVSALDPALPIGRTTTLEKLLEARSGTPRFTSSLVGGFAVLAVVLMVSGIYGLLAFLASARASEMGVRLALGATRTAVASLLLRQALRLAVAGAALGIVASLFVAPWLSTMLFGVEPTDPMTLAVVAALILVVAAAAAALPARRAARVDPVVALRAE